MTSHVLAVDTVDKSQATNRGRRPSIQTGAIMDSLEDQRPFAWQPLTPRGVAAFAGAPLGRLLLVQFTVAFVCAAAVVWFIEQAWSPTVKAAIDRLPAEGNIQSGLLNWKGNSPILLAESRFLALEVDLAHQGQLRSPAHLQVEFGRNGLWIYSLFGRVQFPYPKTYVIAFNLEELRPWWGAWSPALLTAAGVAVIVGLMASWWFLATLYCLPIWLLALYCDRVLTLRGSWKLAGTALMPGALVMIGAIIFYAFGGLDIVHLIGAWALHLVLGWTYAVLAVLGTIRIQAKTALNSNPFARAGANPARLQDSQPAAPESLAQERRSGD